MAKQENLTSLALRTENPAAELLAGFEQETISKAVDDFQRSLVVAMICFLLFGVLDYFVYRELFAVFCLIRLVVIITYLCLFLITRTRFGARYPRELAMVQYLVCCLSIVLMVYLSRDSSSPYYAGINLVLIFFLAMMPLDPVRTLVVTAIVYAAYLAAILLAHEAHPFASILGNNFFLVFGMILVIISSQRQNRMRFLEFSGRFRLAQANEELKKLDEMKSLFFANVSHEVRTPLTSILAPIQSLFQGDLGPLDPEKKQLIGQVYRNALKLLDMVNQMLDVSKFEARKMQLRLSNIDLDEMAQDIVTTFQEVTERKGLHLRYLSEGTPRRAYLDPEKLERILTNLIRNAIKFTESGSITVRVGYNGSLWVEVRDTGIGIAPQHLQKVFTRFQQVDSSSTRRYEGTGLGLTIVKDSVELMRGRISVSSEEGRGSTFRVELPTNLEELVPDAFVDRRQAVRRQPPPQTVQEERRFVARRATDLDGVDSRDFISITVDHLALIERDQVSRGFAEEVPSPANEYTDRILLVEDNSDLRAYFFKMLTRLGHQVTTAIDGLDGWEQVQTDPPDLVVSDVMMPRMDGFELMDKIKHSERTRQIPVIMVTAKPELEARLEGFEKGADDYLPKPVNVRELDARIRNLLSIRNLQRSLAREAELGIRMDELSMSFSQSLEIRDLNTAGHSRDVLNLGSIIAEEIGIPIDRTLKESLLLHDIGKLGIPDRILLKESPLTEEEWKIMKTHPELGAKLLGHFESYRTVSEIILAHQEHFDGSGYPKGLKGDAIPLYARIIAIADAYHAMTSNRPYRKALPAQEAVQELVHNQGRQFDNALVSAFVKSLLQGEHRIR